jgi:hypothetical protein
MAGNGGKWREMAGNGGKAVGKRWELAVGKLEVKKQKTI